MSDRSRKTYLDRIIEVHRASMRLDDRNEDDLLRAVATLPSTRGFRGALVDSRLHGGPAVIAEVKRASPSKGVLREDLDPAKMARSYARGGASCISVLTDVDFFAGSPGDLAEARSACDLPVLRKDFTVSRHDVIDARLMGADAILLIVAALSDRELREFKALATEIGLDALVEVHDEPELDRALNAGADMIGVNQRDLVTFEVDTNRAVRMAPLIPVDVIRVAESGIRGPDDAMVLEDAGFDALLVGETLVTSEDPAAMLRALRLSS